MMISDSGLLFGSPCRLVSVRWTTAEFIRNKLKQLQEYKKNHGICHRSWPLKFTGWPKKVSHFQIIKKSY